MHINASCNGKGSCGKCKLRLESGNAKSEQTSLLSDREKEKNYILACQTEVLSDVTVKIPEETIERKLKVVGTTSIVVYLVDMTDGSIIAATSGHNKQAACGDDVINRIVCAEKDGVGKLSRMVLATINNLISEALSSVDLDFKDIKNVVISGNTTMTHLLLKIEPRYIRREPYIPTVAEFPVLQAGDIGIKANSIAAVFIMPGPASYVGGDIVSGLIYSGLHREKPLTLFIDVGTNGEIVLGNKDWLMTASCSAGPAFEGGGVRWGMRAEEGAIEKVSIDPETLEPTFSTVGNLLPRGICGSGMIDLLSGMLLSGIISPNGKFKLDSSHYRIKQEGKDLGYIVAFADDTVMGEDIVFKRQVRRSIKPP